MNSLLPNFLLVNVLPSLVVPLLIALVAILGIARWRRTLLILALVELICLVVGLLTLRIFVLGAVLGVARPFSARPFALVQTFGTPLIAISLSTTTIGLFLALTLVARSRRWGWFVALLLAAIISALAAEVAFSSYPLTVLLGYPTAHALQTLADPLYTIITSNLVALSMLVHLLYAIFGPREPHAAPAITDDATLP